MSLLSNCVIGALISDKFGINFPIYYTNLGNINCFFTFPGGFISCTALIFSGSGFTPALESSYPTYVTLSLRNSHFSGFSFKLNFLNLSNTCHRRLSWCCQSLPQIRISMMASHPSMFLTMSEIAGRHPRQI